jgi:MraZ protein
VLRGNSPAKIDDRGRLKIPNGFRSLIEDEHGRELFVTSLHGDSVRIYPMAVWIDLEKKLAQIPSSHPSRLKFLDRVNFYGQVSFGQVNYLEVWNHERFVAKLQREPFTDDDARSLSDLGL